MYLVGNDCLIDEYFWNCGLVKILDRLILERWLMGLNILFDVDCKVLFIWVNLLELMVRV